MQPPIELLAGWPPWTLWLAGTAILATAAGVLARTVLHAVRAARQAGAWVAGIVHREVAEIVTAQTLSPDRVAAVVRECLVPLADELRPNHGASLRDAVDRIEARTESTERRVEHHIDDLAAHRRVDHGPDADSH